MDRKMAYHTIVCLLDTTKYQTKVIGWLHKTKICFTHIVTLYPMSRDTIASKKL